MQLEIDYIDRKSLRHIWNNMRRYDKQELKIQGFSWQDAKLLEDQQYAYCLKLDDKEPIAVGGATFWPNTYSFYKNVKGNSCENRILIWGFGTDKADKYMLQIHKHVKIFLKFLDIEEWRLLQSVFVWEKHNKSRVWLNRLGFEDSRFSAFGLNNERILLMERPGLCADPQRP